MLQNIIERLAASEKQIQVLLFNMEGVATRDGGTGRDLCTT